MRRLLWVRKMLSDIVTPFLSSPLLSYHFKSTELSSPLSTPFSPFLSSPSLSSHFILSQLISFTHVIILHFLFSPPLLSSLLFSLLLFSFTSPWNLVDFSLFNRVQSSC